MNQEFMSAFFSEFNKFLILFTWKNAGDLCGFLAIGICLLGIMGALLLLFAFIGDKIDRTWGR